MPHIAGGKRGWFNDRFAQPGRSVGQHGSHWYPGDQFPFTYPVTTDPVTGQQVRAIPGEGSHVPVWILGSSLYGAQLAA